MNPETETKFTQSREAGGGMLTVVAVLGLLLTLVQGTVYYRAKESSKFLGSEKNKVLAVQMAEAGIEDNIADLGKRKTKVHMGQVDTVTYDRKALEGGSYSSKLTTVAVGDSADTVDLMSTGSVGTKSQSIHARMRLKKYIAMITTPVASTTVLNPLTVPLITTALATSPLTPLSTACLTAPGNPMCFVCHLPSGDPSDQHVLNQLRSTILAVYGNRPGDYITTAAVGCGRYNPTVTWTNITSQDTTVKVSFLSWK